MIIELLDVENRKVEVEKEPLGDPYVRLVNIDENLIRYPSYSPVRFNDVREGRLAITVGKGENIEALHKEDLKCGGESTKTIQIKLGKYDTQAKVDSDPKALDLKQPIILSNVRNAEKQPKTLIVGVILSEEGKVISARLIQGDREFQSFAAMEQAAVKSTFERPVRNGQPVEYATTIAYKYKP
ncbi:MAG: hypothetical protein IPM25_13395 [Chloracidobacterium sp.]|nr:hypothetical protein [Chloracidobacterium sp.]